MTTRLLPVDFDAHVADAVREFWRSRGSSSTEVTQGGSRDAVVSGKNMDGFVALVSHVAGHCGLPASAVHTRKSKVVLPGFFRATKNWDVLVIHERRLLGVFEFKSQVGSFGNNFRFRKAGCCPRKLSTPRCAICRRGASPVRCFVQHRCRLPPVRHVDSTNPTTP